MKLRHYTYFALCLFLCNISKGEDWIAYEGKSGPGKGKHIVFLAGDEEYRSEEALPMLAKILSQRHGFKCSVLFSVNEDGFIDPNNQASLSGAEILDTADAIVMSLRFRNWPGDKAAHFVKAFQRGIPIIGLRTSTHAFQYRGDRDLDYRWLNKFGKNVLGEEWVSHWARHKREATRGVIEESQKSNAILRGVSDIFGDTDVYEAYPPSDAIILVRGLVLKGMKPSDPPAKYNKKRRSDRQEQDINGPMMAIAWTRQYKNDTGTTNPIFCTTMGSATDFQSEGLRRLVINSVYWGLGLEVPNKANVDYIDEFNPTMYGSNGFRGGIKPSDHAVGKVLPAGSSNR